MKKLVLLLGVIVSSAFVYAQDNCLAFFPEKEGAVLVSKTYDVNNDLLNVITYTVGSTEGDAMYESVQVNCDITDAQGYTLDRGQILASCANGNFYLKMKNQTTESVFFDILGSNTQLVGNFLDYPNVFADDFPADNIFGLDEGEYLVQSKTDKNEKMSVKVYDRQYEKTEKITTPAGTFHASKISFMFDTIKDKKATTHKGVEWYAENAGIVRSETYDKQGKLENYTVLTVMK